LKQSVSNKFVCIPNAPGIGDNNNLNWKGNRLMKWNENIFTSLFETKNSNTLKKKVERLDYVNVIFVFAIAAMLFTIVYMVL